MDIWAWVHQVESELYGADQEDFAELISDFPGICLSSDSGAVEGAYAQFLYFAAESELPWLEVFARHWYLQHQLCIQNNIKLAMPEAVRLLEIAHREENADCPQSVCAVQDLCIAYGNTDGPGYVEERKQVCRETLDRINPNWPCFECISAEYAEALLDEGKPEEALKFLDAQERRLPKSDSVGSFQINLAECCWKTDRIERALKLTARRYYSAGDNVDTERRIVRGVALARRGEMEEARKIFPQWRIVKRSPASGVMWADGLLEMVELGTTALDGERLGQDIEHLHELAEELAERGGIRPAFQVGAASAELALRRGEIATATRVLELLRKLLPRLRKPCGADVRLAELEARLGE